MDCPKAMVVTANLGSLFDEDKMDERWFASFKQSVQANEPQVISLHLQEVGGKDYEVSMHKVDSFVGNLMALDCMENFDRLRGYLDKDFQCVDQFTALGSLYIFHRDLPQVELWDTAMKAFVPLVKVHRVICCDQVPADTTFIKEKFPTHFYPGVRWSRKGYLATKWNILGNIVHFVNIHLFHDESNIIAMEESPSEYSKYRKTALGHVLYRLKDIVGENEPLFLYGDFNFRLDLKAVVQFLTDGQCSQRIRSDDGHYNKLVFRNSSDDNTVTIEKKKFYISSDKPFTTDYSQLLPFDIERDQCQLKEMPVTFQPSYPFSEEFGEGSNYLPKRCPAWCDRILMNDAAIKLINKTPAPVEYDMMGKGVCVGDHKPIYLTFSLEPNGPFNPAGQDPANQ